VVAAACIIEPPPGASVGTPRETVSADNTPEFSDGPLARQVVLSVPAGALEDATKANLLLGGSAMAEPFPAVDFVIGDPINQTLTVDSFGSYSETFTMPVPEPCEADCEYTIPVTITQVGSGNPPTFSWSVSVFFTYDNPNPPHNAEEMTAEIQPAEK
jgi:hypothetical protein